MYTQCPDCNTAFRVTAEVLKQAAGKVRCGGCGNAFNALEYLSEDKPSTTSSTAPEPSLPELKPESESPPQSISAEQSAALLKTLDELAGSDIRIEDTGIEWRVLDDDDDIKGDVADVLDTRGSSVDEVLEESPTPVDQFLTATPNEIDAAEVFEEEANVSGNTPVDELRFDDNTPLPEDFDFGDEKPYVPETPAVEETPMPPVEPQADLDLSEPDEWEDILDEFKDLRGSTPAALEAELAALEEDVADLHEESPAEAPAETVSAEEQELLDMDTQFALQAEAMGIDLSGIHEGVEQQSTGEPDVAELEVAADAMPDEAAATDDEHELAEPGEEPPIDLVDEDDSAADDAPYQFDSVKKELAELEDQSDVFDSEFFKVADEVAAEIAEEAPDLDEVAAEILVEVEDAAADLEAGPDEAEDVAEEPADEVDEAAEEDTAAASAEASEDDADALIELEEEFDIGETSDLKEELSLAGEPYPEEELQLDEPQSAEDAEIPPMTEEEQTINMMIDQDLLSMAVEDEDGLASTIIIPEKEAKAKEKKKRKKDKKKRKKDKPSKSEIDAEEAQGFETIIMEGEHIRSFDDDKKREADAAEAAELVAASKAEEAAAAATSRGYSARMIGGIVALLLLLIVQVLHQSREALATNSVFNSIASPIYRAIGKPLSPAWDITGWRIEATKGSIEENEETLIVYSRIGNNSEDALPYPIINISLTDRFEETLGSRQLDPVEYLPNGLDPSQLVEPGNTFNAVISIQSPADEASGYELDVCYRGTNGQLRCAIADFK